jgi:hypothetical protein
MLWLVLLFIHFVGNNAPQEMKLKLSSTEYYFLSGSIILFRLESRPDRLATYEKIQDVNEVSLANGYSEKVMVSGPGLFAITIGNLEVERVQDNKQFKVTHFFVRDFEITEQNLRSGLVEIPIKARGAYRVIALDRNEKPVPGATMYLYNTNEAIQLKTNSEGELIFLGSPDDYNMKVLPEGSSIRWKILPL